MLEETRDEAGPADGSVAEEVTPEAAPDVQPEVPSQESWTDARTEFEDLEIPTFIRRQMD